MLELLCDLPCFTVPAKLGSQLRRGGAEATASLPSLDTLLGPCPLFGSAHAIWCGDLGHSDANKLWSTDNKCEHLSSSEYAYCRVVAIGRNSEWRNSFPRIEKKDQDLTHLPSHCHTVCRRCTTFSDLSLSSWVLCYESTMLDILWAFFTLCSWPD